MLRLTGAELGFQGPDDLTSDLGLQVDKPLGSQLPAAGFGPGVGVRTGSVGCA